MEKNLTTLNNKTLEDKFSNLNRTLESLKDIKITSSRGNKIYSINEGTIENPPKGFNLHSVTFIKAIAILLKEGRNKVSKKEILDKAEELKIKEVKETKQTIPSLFSNQVSIIKSLGWLS